MRANNTFPCWLAPGDGQACSLHGVRIGVCPGVRLGRWLSCFAHPLGGVACRGHAQYTAFCSQLLKNSDWVFSLLVSLGFRICPSCTCMQLFLVPHNFFVCYCSRRGMFSCRHCSPEAKCPGSPGLSQKELVVISRVNR